MVKPLAGFATLGNFFLGFCLLLGGEPPFKVLALLGPFLAGFVHVAVQLVSDVYQFVFSNIQTAALAGVSLGRGVIE